MQLGDNVFNSMSNKRTYSDLLAQRGGNQDEVSQKLLGQSEEVGVGRNPASEKSDSDKGYGMTAQNMSNAAEGAQSGDLGKLLSSGGMMAANPYVAGAGLALSYLQGKQQRENQDYMRAIARRQQATSQLMNTFQNQGRLF